MNPYSATTDTIDAAAAQWLSRRDRGLTPAEQDNYMQWLAADPRHAEAVSRHAAALERMMQLYEWTPAHDTEPNPDLFAPPVRGRPRQVWLWAGGLAAAALLAFVWSWRSPGALAAEQAGTRLAAPKSYLRVNERIALPDASRAELKDGTELAVQYSEKERRVKLAGGEAHFSVWKDAQRPFVVEVAGVEVRAVGTAFSVRLDASEVKVLVTEGRVLVTGGPSQDERPVGSEEGGGMLVSGGQRVVVPLGPRAGDTPARIEPVGPGEIARELAWQAPRLQFEETPLDAVLAEFNRLNRHQIELGDAELSALRIGGTFRPDNVEGFIRLLVNDTGLGVHAERVAEHRTVLRRVR